MNHHAILLIGSDFKEAGLPEAYRQAQADVHHYEANRLGVGEARQIAEQAWRRPGKAVESIFVIRARDLTAEAQNALLKLLEEPPSGIRFFLVVPHERVLLPTLRSRFSTSTEVNQKPQRDNIEYAYFRAAALAERLTMVGKRVEAKDMDWAEEILSGLEEEAKTSSDRVLLADVLLARRFAGRSGASLKMLLENCALSLPR